MNNNDFGWFMLGNLSSSSSSHKSRGGNGCFVSIISALIVFGLLALIVKIFGQATIFVLILVTVGIVIWDLWYSFTQNKK